MHVKGRAAPSPWNEEVYHAARGCQAASLSEAASCWRGLFWVCQGESKKTAGFLAHETRTQSDQRQLSSAACMLLCLLKHGGLIAGLAQPHAIDDAHPDICQGSYSHTVGLALCTLTPIIVPCPDFLQRRLPSELVQSVAQGLQAREAFVRFGKIATLKRHRSGSGQGLDTVGISVAGAIIAPFGQQTRSQAFACPRQRTPDRLVVMGQKKGADLLVVASNILDHHQQLVDQREHQARLSTDDDCAGDQLGAVQLLDDLAGSSRRVGMLGQAQGGGDLFHRSALSSLERRIGLQKHECRVLVQLGEQGKRGRIVLLEASRQLVYQASLRLDQRT